MQTAAEIMRRAFPDSEDGGEAFDVREWLTRKAERYNATAGKLTGVNCPDCLNRGNYMRVVDGPYGPGEALEECRCMVARRAVERVERSGLGPALRACRFDNYEAREGWQREALETAKRYTLDETGAWLFMGGAVGAGKTHLCTAVCRKMLIKMPVLYAIWPEEIQALKATRFDEDEYAPRMRRLMDIELLYLDDFFKVSAGKDPTATDIQIAHELLNHRYAARKRTIISSERLLDEIMTIDAATGGRIKERCGGFVVDIRRGIEKDWRRREG